MKRYISAILIPCLLLQFVSCYSLNEIPLEDLNNEVELIITTKDSVKYYLKRNITNEKILNNPDVYFSNNWLINPNAKLITIDYKKAYNGKELNIWQIQSDIIHIYYRDISNASIESININNTCLGFGITVAVFIGLIAISGSPFRNIMSK
jgi:hypothetical protein